jgi:NAD(P)H-dependent FMN reductase
MDEPVRILLVTGSTRGDSTNTAALRTARAVAVVGVRMAIYAGLSELPAFNPDDETRPTPHPAVADLRQRLTAADAVLFGTPEYAGTLPGSFKNLLDWTVGGGELYGKPVAWLNVANPGRGEGAQTTLATVLGYLGAVVVESACLRLPVGRDAIGPDGLVSDPGTRDGLARIGRELLGHLCNRSL